MWDDGNTAAYHSIHLQQELPGGFSGSVWGQICPRFMSNGTFDKLLFPPLPTCCYQMWQFCRLQLWDVILSATQQQCSYFSFVFKMHWRNISAPDDTNKRYKVKTHRALYWTLTPTIWRSLRPTLSHHAAQIWTNPSVSWLSETFKIVWNLDLILGRWFSVSDKSRFCWSRMKWNPKFSQQKTGPAAFLSVWGLKTLKLKLNSYPRGAFKK